MFHVNILQQLQIPVNSVNGKDEKIPSKTFSTKTSTQKLLGKISVQPHPTLCIQFLDRENNDKNNTLLFTLCGNFTNNRKRRRVFPAKG